MIVQNIIPGTELISVKNIADSILINPPAGSDVPEVIWNLRSIARLQKTTGQALRDLVAKARYEGYTWSQIAREIGMPYHTTLIRQYKSGGLIIVTEETGKK